jgi:hypothetical protein
MRYLVLLALGLTLLVATVASAPPTALAADWGGIVPAVTSAEQVRARYGPPTKEVKRKVDGYDTFEWMYEGPQSPAGFTRMTIEFGILLPGGYSPTTVRVLRLDPRPRLFNKDTVVTGWGEPDRATTQNDRDVFFYRSGLVVTFDQEGVDATSLFFTVMQPDITPSPPEAREPPAAGTAGQAPAPLPPSSRPTPAPRPAPAPRPTPAPR